MPLHLDRPGAACTVAVSLVAAVAALLPATARADDPLSPVDAVAPLTGATPAAGDTIVTAVPEVAPVLEQVSGVDAATTPGASVADEIPAAEPEPEPAATVEAQPAEIPAALEPAADQASTGDTTPAEGDIAPDTPAAATTPAEQPAAGAPAKAVAPPAVTANVNVSVRIGSAGDNGPVTQLNVLGGDASRSATGTTADPVDPVPAAETTATDHVTQSPVTAPTGEWYWNWDCLGSTAEGAISPGLLEGVSFPTTWTWNWNCGDNSSKYQSETPSRYQQINTNISIRISSPGNDGSVSQVNVGAAVAVSLPGAVRGLPAPAGSMPLPAPVTAVLDTVLESPGAAVSSDTTVTGLPAVPTEAGPGEAIAAAPPTSLAGVPTVPVATAAPAVGLTFPRWERPWWYAATTAGPTGVGAATSVARPWRLAEPVASPAAHPTSEDRATDRSPHRRTPLPGRVPVLATSGVSATAGGAGGGGSGSGIPALLLLPFVAVLLDLARRVALEHAALPTGHRRRAPDRPG